MIQAVTECLESLQMVSNRLFLLSIETRGGPCIVSDSREFPALGLPCLITLNVRSVEQPNCLFDRLELPILRTVYATDVTGEGLWLSQPPFLSLLSRYSSQIGHHQCSHSEQGHPKSQHTIPFSPAWSFKEHLDCSVLMFLTGLLGAKMQKSN
jgi:hypothetical protein